MWIRPAGSGRTFAGDVIDGLSAAGQHVCDVDQVLLIKLVVDELLTDYQVVILIR